jgi:hypothetical protein
LALLVYEVTHRKIPIDSKLGWIHRKMWRELEVEVPV